MSTKVCLVLTETTIKKDLQLVQEYAGYFDIVELRVDMLFSNETFYIRHFPELAGVPTILTCRRLVDGGRFKDGEGARMTVLAKALSFLHNDPKKNFAYVDFESDFASNTLEEAAKAFDIKIIRSLHSLKKPISNMSKALNEIRRNSTDIVKLATTVPTLKDASALFLQAPNAQAPYIVSGCGRYGALTRIFAQRLGSEIVYTFSKKFIEKNNAADELVDPITLRDLYGFTGTGAPKIFAVVGEDVTKSGSPAIHNTGFRKHNMDSCYVPISGEKFSDIFNFAKKINIQGLSITAPFKEEAYNCADKIEGVAAEVMAINTMVNKNGVWVGYNTDTIGIQNALLKFLGNTSLKDKKIAVIGAGGAAKAVCFMLHSLQDVAPENVCVFNRTKSKAEKLSKQFGFKANPLFSAATKLAEFSDLIIQCTTAGSVLEPNVDPIPFYQFTGKEKVFDVVYEPEATKLLVRAKKSGCAVCNGYTMLQEQAFEQFKLFTGRNYE